MPKFYVACPLGDRTGGPEALALLVHSMRKRGVDAHLIPMRNFRGRQPHPEYDYLDYSVVDHMPRHDDAHLVLTEVSPIESRTQLNRTADQNIWMLWLSVNNSPIPAARYYRADETCCSFWPPGSGGTMTGQPWSTDETELTGPVPRVRESVRRAGGWTPRTFRQLATHWESIRYAESTVRRNINFGTQSYYGQGFIRTRLQRDSFVLTDYPRVATVASQTRESNLVAYNGAKGKYRLPDLRDLLPDVTFVPIEGMTFDEVCRTLARATLYVELGNLPGRDRLPREAANYGTPTVLLARGAGYCWDDFPIGERYRIPYTTDWAARMAQVIRDVLADPRQINEDQSSFREWVAGEPARYDMSLDAWLSRVATH